MLQHPFRVPRPSPFGKSSFPRPGFRAALRRSEVFILVGVRVRPRPPRRRERVSERGAWTRGFHFHFGDYVFLS